MDVRANRPDRAWVPWSIDSFENTLSSCTLHLISSHVLRYLLFSFGCSGEPVQSCVSSLSIDSFEKYSTFVYFTCIISSHVHIYLLFSFGCSGEPVQSCVSSLKYRFLWKIQHIRVLYMHNIISYAYICYFLMDVRANRPDRAWVPWSIDSFENTLSSCTLHLISSHVLRYLLFSFGCSGEPVQSCVSSLKYRFLWKIQHIRVLYMHNIISYTHISVIFFGCSANQSSRAWVPWSIDSFEKYSTFVYFTCIISSHIRIYLLFSFGCSGEPARPRVSSLEYRFLWKYTIFVYFTSNIISCTQIYLIFFWMFGRTSPVVREFPEV